jgi:hypothetical protein
MNDEQALVEKLHEFIKLYKYEYVGGGYFRDMSVPKGTSADIVHGDEFINKFCGDLVKYLADGHGQK